ncbi:MAG TPA: hypothetical protein PLT98_00150, partial [Thauera aminoaromatica]|nr:hypothetical protein [Thauera aminoaromatica]
MRAQNRQRASLRKAQSAGAVVPDDLHSASLRVSASDAFVPADPTEQENEHDASIIAGGVGGRCLHCRHARPAPS